MDNRWGAGKTRLIGTFPGFGYSRHPDAASRAFFASFLTWVGKVQHIRSNEPRMTARLHAGEGGVYLWVTNPTRVALTVQLELSEQWGPFSHGEMLWGQRSGKAALAIKERRIHLTVSGRDAAVVKLME